MTTFEPLHTPRLIVRRLRDDDLSALVAYRSDPAVMRMQLWDSYDERKGRALIEQMQRVAPFTPGTDYQFGVEMKGTGALIGDLYWKTDGAGTQAELGYSFATMAQGQGLATEAARCLVHHAFAVKGFHRVYALTDPRHTASIRLMQRLGMRQEAHFRENLWFKGAWADDVVYAILEREWLGRAA